LFSPQAILFFFLVDTFFLFFLYSYLGRLKGVGENGNYGHVQKGVKDYFRRREKWKRRYGWDS
jgi:hypothetical protein